MNKPTRLFQILKILKYDRMWSEGNNLMVRNTISAEVTADAGAGESTR